MTLTLGSLFDGIGGFPLAFSRAGVATRWVVELDAACRTVSAHHFPVAEAFTDVRDCGAHNLAPVDIITFGSPCQDLSVAGRRAGLDGDRSGLFFEAVRIVRELRPAWAIWENVPGALSSNGGRDFGAALDALADAGAVDLCWRVLDAQWFGVAQRRRRVFLVASFRAGASAAEILFEPEGGGRDTPARGETGESLAYCLAAGAGGSKFGSGRQGQDTFGDEGVSELAHSLRAQGQLAHREDVDTLIPEVSGPRVGRSGEGGHRQDLDNHGAYIPVVQAVTEGAHGVTLTDVASALQSGGGKPGQGFSAVATAMAVRRLTPLETLRLQGYPDDWLDGLGLSDSTKYRMVGNSIAVPVVAWLAARLVAAAEGRA